MSLVSLAEFLHLSRLGKGDLVQMLDNGELPVEIGPTREVLVDLDLINPEDLARRLGKSLNEANQADVALLEEAVATELTNALEGIVEDSYDLALSWLSKRQNPA